MCCFRVSRSGPGLIGAAGPGAFSLFVLAASLPASTVCCACGCATRPLVLHTGHVWPQPSSAVLLCCCADRMVRACVDLILGWRSVERGYRELKIRCWLTRGSAYYVRTPASRPREEEVAIGHWSSQAGCCTTTTCVRAYVLPTEKGLPSDGGLACTAFSGAHHAAKIGARRLVRACQRTIGTSTEYCQYA